MRKKVSQIIAIAEMLALPQLRRPVTYVLILAIPAMFLYLFWLVGGMRLGRHVLFGSLIAIPLNAGIIALPQSIVIYKFRKLQDMYIASPVTQFVYLMGNALARLLFAIPGVLFIGGILLLARYMPVRAIPITIVVLLLSWAVGCALGFMIAMYITNVMVVSEVTSLLALVMVMLPPVSYPLELVGSHWRWVTLMVPSTSAAQLIKVASGASQLNAPAYVLTAWAVLLGSCLLFLWIALTKSSWREA
jgi:ABC-2 type transport system permease protein